MGKTRGKSKKSVSRKKPSKLKAPKFRGLFDKFENTKFVRQGESLRFRDSKGSFVKFDARKNLIAEIWLGNKKTNKVLNKTKKGIPTPQKFDARTTKKRMLFLENAKKGPRVASEPKFIRTKFDSHFTIVDNILAKCDDMLTDIIEYSKRGNGAYVTIEFTLEEKHQVINSVIKGQKKPEIALDLARLIIHRFYRNELRASSLKDTAHVTGKRFSYVRSYPIKFTWDETKRLKDL